MVAFAGTFAAPAAAERSDKPTYESIEWRTARSSLVVLGKATAAKKQRYVGGDTAFYDVTFTITETIKGEPRPSVKFMSLSISGTPWVWPANKHELLVFLVDSKERAPYDKRFAKHPLAPYNSDDAIMVMDAGDEHHAYSTSFAVLRDRDAILAAARAAATSTATVSHEIDVPIAAPVAQSFYPGSAVFLTVPVDARLEELARGWLASNDPTYRVQGVAALAHFRTPANQLLVAASLGDPGVVLEWRGTGVPQIRHFQVRSRAHQVLDAWGVQHATPVVVVPHTP